VQVPKKRARRRVVASRPRPQTPTTVNRVWAYDFVFDTCADGRILKCLTVIDEFTRGCLAIDVAGGIRSGRVIEVLTRLVGVHGAHTAQIETAFIDPGTPGRTARTNRSTASSATSISRYSGLGIAPTRR
jgi:transposase InsO family protein